MSESAPSAAPRPACRVAGLLLAAGEGRRAGGPKALRNDLGADSSGATWVERAADTLLRGGCDTVTVVVGAAAAEVRGRLEGWPVQVVEAADWADGLGASLRAGLRSLMTGPPVAESGAGRPGPPECACVHLVDLPDVGPEAIARVLSAASPGALVRASYDGRVGHPVLLGREHWSAVHESSSGDRGAGPYLREHGARLVDCSDLATGRDVDTPPDA